MKKLIICLLSTFVLVLAGCGSMKTGNAAEGNDAPENTAEEITVEYAQLYNEDGTPVSDETITGLLEGYYSTLEENPTDLNAQIGSIRCHIALGDYYFASTGLSFLSTVYPGRFEICDIYQEMSNVSGERYYAETASEMAINLGYLEFIEKIPDEPSFSVESGAYTDRFTLELTAEEGSTIHVTVVNSDLSIENSFEYSGPITLYSGENTIYAYAEKDGYYSTNAEHNYLCDFEPVELNFSDAGMEQLVRITLGLSDDEPVTDIRCAGVTELDTYELYNVLGWEKMKSAITSLDDLCYFPNLSYLEIYNCRKIGDYSPVSSCASLEYLYIMDSNVSDISFVANLDNLYVLQISYCEDLTDIGPVYKAENLLSFYCYGNEGSFKADISRLDKLQNLGIDPESIEDWNDLLLLDDLYYLDLDGSFEAVDYDVLSQLTSLEYLYFYGNYNWRTDTYDEMSDLSFLDNLTKLEYLTLWGVNDPSQLSHLSGLTSLANLRLYNCGITSDSAAMSSLYSMLPGCNIDINNY